MNTFGRRAAAIALAAVLGSTSLAGCGSKDSNLDGTQTVMTIDGVEVPVGVLSFAIRYSQAQMESYYGAYMSQMMGSDGSSTSEFLDQEVEDGVTYGDQLKDDQVKQLKKMYVTYAKAADYDIELTDDQETEIAETAKEFIEANDEDTLKKIGVTEDNVKTYLELYTVYQSAEDPVTADTEITVTDDEAAQSTVSYCYLAKSSVDSDDEDTLATLKSKMEELLEKIKASDDPSTADFSSLASEVDDTIMATSTSYGSDDESVADDIKDAAADLKDGEVCDEVIEGDAGYYIVRMDKTLDEDATAEKKESLETEKRQEAFDDIEDGWVDDADIDVNKKVLKKITVNAEDSFNISTGEDTSSEDASSEDTTTEDSTDASTTEDATTTEDSTDASTTDDAAVTSDDNSGETTEETSEDTNAEDATDTTAEDTTTDAAQ